MKVLVLGDTHGEFGWIKLAARKAQEEGCSIILQCGDFGYWEHVGSGKFFLDNTERFLAERDLELWWVDGNHENHTLLRETHWPKRGGLRAVRPHIFYIPRGYRWEWDGVSFLGLGGAYSVDMGWRTEGVSWWPEETITEQEVAQSIKGGHADVMVTHDCPVGVDPFGPETVGSKDTYPISFQNRKYLRTVADAVKPRVLFHGHYHHRHTSTLHGGDYETIVEGMGRDGDYRSMLVFDTASILSPDAS